MAEILVLVDHADGEVKKVTLELLTLARSVGEPSAVFVGSGADKAIPVLAEHGAAKVYVAEAPELAEYLIAPRAQALATAVRDSSAAAVLVASSADGKEVAARLAVKLDSGVITDAVGLAEDLSATQSIFGGSVIVTSRVATGTPVITVRPNSAPVEVAPAAGERVDLTVELGDADKGAKVTGSVEEARDARPDLAEAAIVVSGGRGVGGEDNFTLIEALADTLGAAVGASRAATDAGWYPHQFQVGQTGKTVSPQLYIANGISGAIQHRAGMQTSKTIVVVNKDPEAPIFELADYGVVGDLFAVVPQLTEEIKKRKA